VGGSQSPTEIFDRAVEEGNRRLDQSLLELVSTSFIAGFTIVFGIVALGIVEALVEPEFGHVGKLAGALAFGVLFGASIGFDRIAFLTVAVTAGHFVGGLGLVTFAHVTLVRGLRVGDR
jgi:hypothetical protein